MRIANNVTELIGNTPLVRLNRLSAGIAGSIAGKLAMVGVPSSGDDTCLPFSTNI